MISASSFAIVFSTSLDNNALGESDVKAAFSESIFQDMNLYIFSPFVQVQLSGQKSPNTIGGAMPEFHYTSSS